MAITISQSLESINAYPIPAHTLEYIAASRELPLDRELDALVCDSTSFNLARADVYLWLSQAPDVTQAGISYKFSESDRKEFRRLAQSLYSDNGVEVPSSLTSGFGYKGELL